MSTTAPKPATTPMPVPLSAPECAALILPHRALPKRDPTCNLGYSRVLHLILWVRYTGRHGQCLPVPTATQGQPAIHDTSGYNVFAKWAKAGARWQAFVARGRQLAAEQQLDSSVLHGARTTTVAKKRVLGVATRGTNPRQGSRASP